MLKIGSRAVWGCMGWLSGALARPPAPRLQGKSAESATTRGHADAKMQRGELLALPVRCPERYGPVGPGHVPSSDLLQAERPAVWFDADPIKAATTAKRKLPLTITAPARSGAPGSGSRGTSPAPHRHAYGAAFLSRFGTDTRTRARHGRDRIDDEATRRRRELFDYWDALRGTRTAPDRSEIDPGAIRASLPNMFVLGLDAGAPPSVPAGGNVGLRAVRTANCAIPPSRRCGPRRAAADPTMAADS